MNSAVRIGVAGAGLIGRKHIELVAASPDCVAGRNRRSIVRSKSVR